MASRTISGSLHSHGMLAFLAAAALAAFSITPATALSAVYSYSFSAGNASVDPARQSATVPIYLHESSSDGSSQIDQDGGLYSAGLMVTITSGPGNIASLVRNPAFDETENGTTTLFPASTASLWSQQNANFGNGAQATSGDVLLATLTIDNLTGPTGISISDFGSGSQIVDYAGSPLDPTSETSLTIAAPEPASLAYAVIPLIFLLCGRGVGARNRNRPQPS